MEIKKLVDKQPLCKCELNNMMDAIRESMKGRFQIDELFTILLLI
jgi:hypothetical protein